MMIDGKYRIAGSFLFLVFFLFVVEDFFLIFEVSIDRFTIRLATISGNYEFIENEVSLNKYGITLWKLKIRSNSHTFPKYLSKISTNEWINYKTMSSFSSLSTIVMKYKLAYRLYTILYYL